MLKDKSNIDLMKPIDITKFGTDNDPCFGKHYDLKAEECQRCGDHEFCAITTAQKLHTERAELESKSDYLDVIEEVKETKHSLTKIRLKKAIKTRISKGFSFIKTYKSLDRKFIVDKEEVRTIYKDLKV
tara:strand:+ start:117 stop:503 length:387 start_codon:yes stop_codon:yes gene_type:complete